MARPNPCRRLVGRGVLRGTALVTEDSAGRRENRRHDGNPPGKAVGVAAFCCVLKRVIVRAVHVKFL